MPNIASSSQQLSKAKALHQSGQLQAAEQLYKKIPKQSAEYVEALRLRGLICIQKKQFTSAISLLRKALKKAPKAPIIHHTLAESYNATAAFAQAIAHYKSAWQLDPTRLANGEDLAKAQEKGGYTLEAIHTLQKLSKQSRDKLSYVAQISQLYYERGELAQAFATLNDAPEAQSPKQWYQKGQAWHRLACEQAAKVCFEKALQLTTKATPRALLGAIYAGLANALQLQGEHGQASALFERAMADAPDIGWPYFAILDNRQYQYAPAQVEDLKARAKQAKASQRCDMYFALATHYHRQKEYATAFSFYKKANDLHAQNAPFDRTIFNDRIERIIKTCTAEFFSKLKPRQPHSLDEQNQPRPVFIVGMPRSGTSLVEQIIASHPKAFGAGELKDIRRMIQELPALTQSGLRYPQGLAKLKSKDIQALSKRYLGSLAARGASAEVVTDKMPFNFIWLGLIAILFPQARIIYCRRAPLDNCLSCYVQDFNQGLRFSYNLTHLGGVYRQHEKLMAHWQQHLPLDILTVDYEQLVADQERLSRQIIEFAELPWDPVCLNFHKINRSVHTASNWQVRQPIYQTSVARWKAYEPWLGELKNALNIATECP